MFKKTIALMAMILLSASLAWADQKVTAMPQDSTLTSDELIPTVYNPAGTPVNHQTTVGILQSTILAGNAATATQLNSTPTGCSAGYFPTGIDTHGNFTGCTQATGSGTVNSGTINAITRYTGANTVVGASGILFDDAANVGIGTSLPVSKLTVSGNGTFGSGYKTTAAPTNGLLVQGNMGVGSSNPGTALDVAGTIRATSGFQGPSGVALLQGTTGAQLDPNGSGPILYVTTGGNVGIGSSAPGKTLDVFGSVRLTNSGQYFGDGSQLTGVTTLSGLTTNKLIKATSSTAGGNSQIFDDGTNVGIGSVTPGSFLDVQGSVRIFGGSGNVGIGTLTPGAFLDVAGATRIQGAIITYGASAPTVATGAGDCGTSPAIAGNNSSGTVTVGSSSNGSKCTITFSGTLTSTPHCLCNNRTTGNLCRATSPGTTTVALSGTLTAADVLDYVCVQ